jgi:radical SAM protein with 4Fe4S-binding SPASM domain
MGVGLGTRWRAWRRVRRARRTFGAPRGFRAEKFGGIIQTETPRALVFVDRAYARRLGHDGGALWDGAQPDPDAAISAAHLSAPLEAHLQLTNKCDAGCTGCYTGATPQGGPSEWGREDWLRAVDALADQGVLHLALGGGESALLPWLGDIVRHARARGMVPNLTTSGLSHPASIDELVELAPLFGQINVSLDGVGEVYAAVRGFDGFAQVDAAVQRLRAATPHVGVNTVVTRHNFEHLEAVFAYCRSRGLKEIELLRFKPAGRGAGVFGDMTCTDAQHRAILPLALRLARRYRRRVRMDCSYTPMVAHHKPGARLMQWLAIFGCAGGDMLIGAKAHGKVSACSFAAPPAAGPSVHNLAEYWESPEAFAAFRSWRQAAEPCNTCEVLHLCRGGCRVVSAHVSGSLSAPDPECPRVIDWRRDHAGAPDAFARRRLPVLAT